MTIANQMFYTTMDVWKSIHVAIEFKDICKTCGAWAPILQQFKRKLGKGKCNNGVYQLGRIIPLKKYILMIY